MRDKTSARVPGPPASTRTSAERPRLRVLLWASSASALVNDDLEHQASVGALPVEPRCLVIPSCPLPRSKRVCAASTSEFAQRRFFVLWSRHAALRLFVRTDGASGDAYARRIACWWRCGITVGSDRAAVASRHRSAHGVERRSSLSSIVRDGQAFPEPGGENVRHAVGPMCARWSNKERPQMLLGRRRDRTGRLQDRRAGKVLPPALAETARPSSAPQVSNQPSQKSQASRLPSVFVRSASADQTAAVSVVSAAWTASSVSS